MSDVKNTLETHRSFSLLSIIAILCLLIGIGLGYVLNTKALEKAERTAVQRYSALMYNTCFSQEKMLGENPQRSRRNCNYLKEISIEN